MPTPGKNIDKISLLFINIKDIFIGNMQKTIYDSHKRSYFNKVALTPVNLIQQWRHKMTHSVNIIVNRLRQRNKPKGYINEWLFCKPLNCLLTQSDETNFLSMLRILIQTTINTHLARPDSESLLTTD